ncbi:MAG: helicase HerA-like domain-containing protein [Leucobacter sp.]
MSDDVEALRVQLAEAEARAAAAEAEAARAKAEAARAELEAARAALGAAERQGASGEATGGEVGGEAEPAPDVQLGVGEPASAADSVGAGDGDPEPAADASGDGDGDPASAADQLPPVLQAIAAGYAFDAPAMTLGTLLAADGPKPGNTVRMPLGMFNRHLLVAGATGTGKTRTLQLIAEGLSAAGSSVLLCDVKGDLTGMAEPGPSSEKLLARTGANGQPWQPSAFPVELLRLGGIDAASPGAVVRVPVSDFGPILLARALDLNTTQEQALQLIFSWADSQGLELVDLGDMRAVITHLTSDEGKEVLATLGGVSKATAGVILRAITALEAQGGDEFFGQPGFDTADLLRQQDGRGVVSLLDVGDMFERPALVSTVIMWLLADLFSALPEVGDPERPKLVFFFDEAHLLFANATKEFLRQVVQTVRLIRSKGVGVVFVTQTPKDIPADVLAQLGSRVQHALRAATPDDEKKLKQTVNTFPNTSLDLAELLTTLGTGEAIVTVLGPDGRPTPVAPTKLWAPASVMGPAQPATVFAVAAASPLARKYAESVDPFSAEEKLEQRAVEAAEEKRRAEEEAAAAKQAAIDAEKQAKAEAAAAAKAEKEAAAAKVRAERAAERERERKAKEAAKKAQRRTGAVEGAIASAMRSAGTQIGREITRTIFGTRRR